MAIIITIDGQLHNVVEPREEIEMIMRAPGCQKIGMLRLTQKMSITGWEKGTETNRTQNESVVFMINNIIKFT